MTQRPILNNYHSSLIEKIQHQMPYTGIPHAFFHNQTHILLAFKDKHFAAITERLTKIFCDLKERYVD